MKKVLRVLLVSSLMLLFAAAIASAAGGGSMSLKAQATASGQTTLVWTFAGGDTMQSSLDGLTWTDVPVDGGTGVRSLVAPSGNNVVVGLTNYTNYYFRIKHADGTHSTVADAFPPNEHAHRYFASDTNACALCHGTHAAVGYHLIKATTVDNMCKTCHAGTGAKYQVDSGTAATAAGTIPVLGGPFGTKFNPTSSITPTSSHMLGASLTTAPGGNPSGPANVWGKPLGCGSCHSAHSGIGYQYRLLKNTLPYMPPEGGTGAPIASIDVEAYAVTAADKEIGVYVKGMNTFCGGCHADYNTELVSGPAHNVNGVFNDDYYRHKVGANVKNFHGGALPLTTSLPLEAGTAGAFLSDGSVHGDGTLACMTCHKPHGVTTESTGSSSLLIMSNRGVCEDCHKK